MFLTLEPTTQHPCIPVRQLFDFAENVWCAADGAQRLNSVCSVFRSLSLSLYGSPSTITAPTQRAAIGRGRSQRATVPLPPNWTRPTSAEHICATNRWLSRLRFHDVAIGRSFLGGI